MAEKTFRDTVSTIVTDILEDNIRLSMPAKIISVADYQETQSIDVKPLVNNLYKDNLAVEYPIIFSVPVVLLGGGGALISVPLKAGDIVKLDFSRDSLQEFLDSTGEDQVTPDTFRRYALTDAIAIPSLPTRNSTLKPNPTDLEIKMLDSSGEVKSSVKMNPEGDVTVENSNDIIINGGGAASISVTGDCNLTADNVNIDAATTNLGTGGQPIARVGDKVNVIITSGSSTGTWEGTILEGGDNTSI